MHLIDWILKNTDPRDTKHLKRTGEMPQKAEDPRGDNADLRHKHCTECGRVWEINRRCQNTKNPKTGKQYKYKRVTVHYFEDMVTYGKVKETCPECEKENK